MRLVLINFKDKIVFIRVGISEKSSFLPVATNLVKYLIFITERNELKYMVEEKRISLPHNLVLEDRKKLSVTGVSDVDSFDEQTIVVMTDMGELTVRGGDLHINSLSIDMGELLIEGDIDSLTYSDVQAKGGGFFSKVFR